MFDLAARTGGLEKSKVAGWSKLNLKLRMVHPVLILFLQTLKQILQNLNYILNFLKINVRLFNQILIMMKDMKN